MTIPIKIISASELNEKPKQGQVWDSIASPWRTYVVKKIPIVEEFLKSKKGLVVDLGCGNGGNMIPNKNIEYWGVDFSSKQLENAKKYIENEKINGKLFNSNLHKLPKEFANNFFGCGLFIATLHCIETKKQRVDSLKEFYRILKPGAEALISVWNSDDKRFNGLKGGIYMSWKENGVSHMRHYYLYDKNEFIGLLEEVGFSVLEIYSVREQDRFSKKNWIVRVVK